MVHSVYIIVLSYPIWTNKMC